MGILGTCNLEWKPWSSVLTQEAIMLVGSLEFAGLEPPHVYPSFDLGKFSVRIKYRRLDSRDRFKPSLLFLLSHPVQRRYTSILNAVHIQLHMGYTKVQGEYELQYRDLHQWQIRRWVKRDDHRVSSTGSLFTVTNVGPLTASLTQVLLFLFFFSTNGSAYTYF